MVLPKCFLISRHQLNPTHIIKYHLYTQDWVIYIHLLFINATQRQNSFYGYIILITFVQDHTVLYLHDKKDGLLHWKQIGTITLGSFSQHISTKYTPSQITQSQGEPTILLGPSWWISPVCIESVLEYTSTLGIQASNNVSPVTHNSFVTSVYLCVMKLELWLMR